MGTTMTSLVLRGEEVFIAQVGDSRCYRVRNEKIEQITEDHSWVNEQVRRGALTREEAETSPFKNIITRSLGNNPTVDVDIYTHDLQVGDIFLLCSDGLSNEVNEQEMKDAMLQGAPSQAALELVELALERGGRDNATVLILAVRDITKEREEESKNKRKGLSGLFGRG